jgi:hypothetical protein
MSDLTNETATRRYLVLVQMSTISFERMASIGKSVTEILKGIATDGHIESVYRSAEYDSFAVAIRTHLAAAQVRYRLAGDRRGDTRPSRFINEDYGPVLHDTDKVLILEIGADNDALRFSSRLEPWLSRR